MGVLTAIKKLETESLSSQDSDGVDPDTIKKQDMQYLDAFNMGDCKVDVGSVNRMAEYKEDYENALTNYHRWKSNSNNPQNWDKKKKRESLRTGLQKIKESHLTKEVEPVRRVAEDSMVSSTPKNPVAMSTPKVSKAVEIQQESGESDSEKSCKRKKLVDGFDGDDVKTKRLKLDKEREQQNATQQNEKENKENEVENGRNEVPVIDEEPKEVVVEEEPNEIVEEKQNEIVEIEEKKSELRKIEEKGNEVIELEEKEKDEDEKRKGKDNLEMESDDKEKKEGEREINEKDKNEKDRVSEDIVKKSSEKESKKGESKEKESEKDRQKEKERKRMEEKEEKRKKKESDRKNKRDD